MTNEEILSLYENALMLIRDKGVNWYKKYIKNQKKSLTLEALTIATSIIAVYDMIEKN